MILGKHVQVKCRSTPRLGEKNRGHTKVIKADLDTVDQILIMVVVPKSFFWAKRLTSIPLSSDSGLRILEEATQGYLVWSTFWAFTGVAWPG